MNQPKQPYNCRDGAKLSYGYQEQFLYTNDFGDRDEDEVIKILSMLYDFIYAGFELISSMICPDRDIQLIISAEDPDGLDAFSFINTIVIYPLVIIEVCPRSTWNTIILIDIAHELYHCLLDQDQMNYNKDRNVYNIVESQTQYMALQFMIQNRVILESKLGVCIDVNAIYRTSKECIPFVLDPNGIKFMDIKKLWMKLILLGNHCGDVYDEVSNILDKYDNVLLTIIYANIDDKNIISEYCLDYTVKENGKYLIVDNEFMDIRFDSAGSYNHNNLPNPIFVINYTEQDPNTVIIYEAINVQNRIPFFIKPT